MVEFGSAADQFKRPYVAFTCSFYSVISAHLPLQRCQEVKIKAGAHTGVLWFVFENSGDRLPASVWPFLRIFLSIF